MCEAVVAAYAVTETQFTKLFLVCAANSAPGAYSIRYTSVNIRTVCILLTTLAQAHPLPGCHALLFVWSSALLLLC